MRRGQHGADVVLGLASTPGISNGSDQRSETASRSISTQCRNHAG